MRHWVKQNGQSARLGAYLESVLNRYQRIEFLPTDPLEQVHECARRSDRSVWDVECVALAAALLAYGNVRQIQASVRNLVGRMEGAAGSPSAWVWRQLARGGDGSLRGFAHRFQKGGELELLFSLLSRSWAEHGSLGAHFLRKDPDLASGAAGVDVTRALTGLLADWKLWASGDARSRTQGFAHLLASPADGSACKRWCLFLRWMSRKDVLDLGLWSPGSPLLPGGLGSAEPVGLRPAALVVPIDTHLARVSRELGLSRRRAADWRMAQEVTARLREFDASDPVKYDFALCRLGMMARSSRAQLTPRAGGRRRARSGSADRAL